MLRSNSGEVPLVPGRLGRVLAILWLVAAVALLLPGLDYYRADPAGRAYSRAHRLFAPTGVVGHTLGYVGTSMVVLGVGGYVARKRWRVLAGAGRLPDWLRVHVFLCTLGPYLVLLHTSFKFGGVAAISFWSMAAAVASGVVGRYLYAHVPRTINGNLRTLAALEQSAEELRTRIGAVAPGLDRALAPLLEAEARPPRSLGRAVALAVRADLTGRRRLRRVRRLLREQHLPDAERELLLRLVRERLQLTRQIALLAPFQRLFHYWHVLHLPVALLMLLTLVLHVTLAVLFGYAWPL